jgi:hypothetical protein
MRRRSLVVTSAVCIWSFESELDVLAGTDTDINVGRGGFAELELQAGHPV